MAATLSTQPLGGGDTVSHRDMALGLFATREALCCHKSIGPGLMGQTLKKAVQVAHFGANEDKS